MITYLQTIKDTKTQRLTPEIWESLTTSPQTQLYITEFRKSGNLDMKQRLPAVNFQGYDPKVLKGLPGSRKQADMLPTGLFMLDIDHIDNPKAVWEKFKQRLNPLTPQGGKNPLAPQGGTFNSLAGKNPLAPQGGTFNSSADKKTTDKSNKDLPLGGIEGVAGVVAEVNPRSWTQLKRFT